MMDSSEKAIKEEMIKILPKLRSFARGLTGDVVQADDLLQNVCERALKKMHQFTPGSQLNSWLYKITVTQWYDHLRKQKKKTEKLINLRDHLHVFESQHGVVDKHNRQQSNTIDLRRALKRLPEEQRVALLLISFEGYNYDEVAGILDLPVGTVASRVARARSNMAAYLSEKKKKTNSTQSLEVSHGKGK